MPAGRWLGALLGAMLAGPPHVPPGVPPGIPPADGVTCHLQVAPSVVAGAPVWLTITLRNTGPAALRILTWATPFEGAWLAPMVDLTRDGVPLPYGGATAKRGDPAREDYLLVRGGRARRARLDLGEAFDLRRPGRYRLVPRLTLADVATAGEPWPRERDAFRPRALPCPTLTFEVTPAPPPPSR